MLDLRTRVGRDHTTGCRSRIEKRMLEDPAEKECIDKRDKRMATDTGKKGGNELVRHHDLKGLGPPRCVT